MPRRELNVWLAFADIVFVLFVCALIASASSDVDARESAKKADQKAREATQAKHELEEKTKETERLRDANRELQQRLDILTAKNRFRCAQVDPLLTHLSSCIEQRLNVTHAVVRDMCSITVSDGLVRFRSGRSTLTRSDSYRATQLAQCLYRSGQWFEDHYPDAFAAIDTIHIDGFTDCVGTDQSNVILGSKRAQTIYEFLHDMAENDFAGNDRWLSKVAVRSFGEARPFGGLPCSAEEGNDAHRRVRFDVDMLLQQALE